MPVEFGPSSSLHPVTRLALAAPARQAAWAADIAIKAATAAVYAHGEAKTAQEREDGHKAARKAARRAAQADIEARKTVAIAFEVLRSVREVVDRWEAKYRADIEKHAHPELEATLLYHRKKLVEKAVDKVVNKGTKEVVKVEKKMKKVDKKLEKAEDKLARSREAKERHYLGFLSSFKGF